MGLDLFFGAKAQSSQRDRMSCVLCLVSSEQREAD